MIQAAEPDTLVGPTTAEKIRRLPWSVASNAANMIFVQFTFFGSAFVLFLNELELNNSQIGLLLSLFPFFGLVALFIAPTVARAGLKRTFLTFYGARKIVAGFLLLTPWVLSRYGSTATLYFVMGIVVIFALCRAAAETALYPWIQEYIPDSVRGKYAALNNIFSNLTGVGAAAVGGLIINRSMGLERFMILIAIGVIFGFIAVWTASFRPGGAPTRDEGAESRSVSNLLEVIRDPNMLRYLVGFGLITLATVPVVSFLPLFMQDEVGLSTGTVVWLQTGTLVGALASTFLWGWAADRYGSKPVLISGIYIKLLLPLGWILMPKNSPISFYVALAIALTQGMSDVGWAIGSGRLLYVRVVPPAKKTAYMAVYYAAIGIFGGVSQLIGGQILDASDGLSGTVLQISLNPFIPLFIGGLLLTVLSLLVFRRVRADSTFSVGDFASKFIHGNPLLALTVLPRYYWAKDERAVVSITERLGQSKSPLTDEELLDALNDPRFNVRFEAVISISRMNPDMRLIQALEDLLTGTELSLSVIAAWALGRIGSEYALESLQTGLNSEYRSIRAHSARAIGAIGDRRLIPVLLEKLEGETNIGLQMAYASALGNLGAAEAATPILNLLATTSNPGARLELALSLARLVGDEQHFINLLRGMRTDPGTTAAQALSALEKRFRRQGIEPHGASLLKECAGAFARQQIKAGSALLSRFILAYGWIEEDRPAALILKECAQYLDVPDSLEEEYILLALHTLEQEGKEI